MNFLRPLPCLLASLVLTAAQPPIQGGGTLTLGAESFQFEPRGAATAPPRGGLPGAIRLKGVLIPAKGGRTITLNLVVLKNGQLYTLSLRRGGKADYPDTWAAEAGTRVKVLILEDHPGGRVELACEGPLTGVVGQRPVSSQWHGRLWAAFPDPGALE